MAHHQERTLCCVPGCSDKTSPRHRFPKNTEDFDIFMVWVARINNPKLAHLSKTQIYDRRRICDRHFEDECKIPGCKTVKKRSVPTLNLPSYSPDVPIDILKVWPGILITDVSEDPSDQQMVEQAEVLHNLHLFEAKFIDVPDTDPLITSASFDRVVYTEDSETLASQPNSSPIYVSRQNSDEVVCNANHINTTENESEEIQNFEMSQPYHDEAVFDSEQFEIVHENNRSCNNTLSGEKESAEVPFKKPYFRSVKSYLKDCNRMTEVCRICFCSLEDKEVIKLFEDSPEQDCTHIKNMLTIVLPDLDLEIYPNTVICTKCVELLLYSYQLKEKWLLTEEKLQKIIQKKKGTISSVADLVIIGKLLTNNKTQPLQDPHANDHAYTEQPFLQEPTRKNVTNAILDNILSQPSEKIAPVSVFYGELDLNDTKNTKHVQKKVYQTAKQNSSTQRNKAKTNIEKKKYGAGPFMCEQCGHIVLYFGSLKKHIIRKHLVSHTSPKERKKVMQNRERKFMCEICGQLFLSEKNLERHAGKHAEYKCSYCNRVFNHHFRLQNHIKSKHIRNSYQCHICGKQMSYARSLQMHIMLHYPKPKLLECQICNKKFRYPCNLKKHLRSHSEGKLLRCEYCGRFLKHEISLQKHIQIYHMNQGKNVCDFCNKPYWKKCDLKKHKIRCHGGGFAVKECSEQQNYDEVVCNEQDNDELIYYEQDADEVLYTEEIDTNSVCLSVKNED